MKSLAFILNLLKQILVFLFGSWTPPVWLRWIFNIIFYPFTLIKNVWLKILPTPKAKKLALSISSLFVLILLGGLVWWIQQPTPVYVQMTGTRLQPTPLRKDAKPMDFRLSFSESAARLDQVGKTVSSGITMEPSLEGTWKWINDQNLVYTPVNDWPVNQSIRVQFGESFFPKHVLLKEREYDFKTPAFKASFKHLEFYQNPVDPKDKKAIATFQFTHPVDPETFKENLKVEINKSRNNQKPDWKQANDLDLMITWDEFKGNAFVHTEAIKSPVYNESIRFTLSKGVGSLSGGNTTENELQKQVTIPGMMTYFRINQIDTEIVRDKHNQPKQVLLINSTARMLQSDLIKHLEVYLLPKDKPATAIAKKQKNYYWGSSEEISEDILAQSRKIKLVSVPAERKYESLLSFELDENPDRFLYVRIGKGIKSFGEYILAENIHDIVKVPPYPKELEFLHEGSLLSLSGEKKLSVMGRGIKGVKFKLSRFLPGQISHLISQTYGDLTSPEFRDYNFNEDNLAKIQTLIREFKNPSPKVSQYTLIDFQQFLSNTSAVPHGLFMLEAQAWDPVKKRSQGLSRKRLILLTDIGLLVKKSQNGSFDLFVQSINTGKPVSGASVQVMGKNGLAVLKRSSDKDGHVSFPNLDDFKYSEKPVAFLATSGTDLSFIPFNSHVDQLNYSRFDIGGEYTHSKDSGLKGYLFSDRGIYRPGENVHLGMIIKGEKWGQNLKDIPVEVIVTNPRGLTIKKDTIKLNALGFQEYGFSTSPASPTGVYSISTYLLKKNKHRKERIGSTTIKVEEFLPDRMKITARYSQIVNKGWISPDELTGLVNLQNLFGTPAANHRVRAEVSLQPHYPSFRGFKEYTFHDPFQSRRRYSEELAEQKTDQDGNAVFNLKLDKYKSATYLLNFFATGYELDGGRSVSASKSVLVSPLEYLVGMKPDGDLNYIAKDAERSVHLIALNSNLEFIEAGNLKLKLIELKQVSTLMKQPNGTYKYESVEKKETLKETGFKILSKGTRLPIPTEKPGDYQLLILNKDDVELNQFKFSVAGAGDLSAKMDRNAELQIKLNKQDFNPGEYIEVQIKAPYFGSGLITIEREKVYSYHWFKTSKTSSIQRIRIPQNMEGNGYVNVTFVRSLHSDEIYMSPLSTAVVPFSISKARRINHVKLKAPELVRPGEDLEIQYSSEKPGKVVIFAVDKGILQVARYQSPNPLQHFLKKKALEVGTRQILDLILPEFSVSKKKLLEVGGGSSAMLAKNLNPFKRKTDKPVAFWSGIMDVNSSLDKIKFKIPDYFNGQLKIFAVSLTNESMGVTQEQTLVRGHFVLNPNIPTFVAPSDRFTLTVGISNNAEGTGKEAPVQVKLETSEHFEVLDDPVKNLKIDENTEKGTRFQIRVKDVLGSGTFRLIASSGERNAKRSIESSVRPPLIYQTTIQNGVVEPGKEKEVLTERRLYPQFRNHETAISSLPLGFAGGLINYLDKFPHGCSEQMVSKSFPALVLFEKPEFGYSKKVIREQLRTTNYVMRSRMNGDGGIGVWDSSTVSSPFHTAYFVHYLTEAKEYGYPIPKDLLSKGLLYLKRFSEKPSQNLAMARTQAYSTYLLSRNGIISTKAIVRIKSFLNKHYPEEAKSDLSQLFLAGAYKLMKSDEEANKLVDSFENKKVILPFYEYDLYDQMTRDGFYLYLTSIHFPEIVKDMEREEILRMINPLIQGNHNTFSSAISILALNRYADLAGKPDLKQISAKALKDKKELQPIPFKEALFSKAEFPEETTSLQLQNESDKDVFYSVTQSGFNQQPEKEADHHIIEVNRVIQDDTKTQVNKVQLGEEVDVTLRIRTIDKSAHGNIAIVDLLPGGFEVVEESVNRHTADYMDNREDRLVIYTGTSSKLKEFRYRIKAVNKGEYVLPAVFGKSMYDQAIHSRSASASITVE